MIGGRSGPITRSNSQSEEFRKHSKEDVGDISEHETPAGPLDDVNESSPLTSRTDSVSAQDPLYALLARLTDAVSSRPNTSRNFKFDAPESFNGTERYKLRPFLNQLEAIFIAQHDYFDSDRAKITYAGTCLSGVAHSWYIARASPTHSIYDPDFLRSWLTFVNLLQYQFGDRDETGTAEQRLAKLRMNANHQCSIYVTKFQEIADALEWPDEPLMLYFKRGLPDRILDVLATRESRPMSLASLQNAALDIDNRYWEIQQFKQSRNISNSDNSNSRNWRISNNSTRNSTRYSDHNISNSNNSRNKSWNNSRNNYRNTQTRNSSLNNISRPSHLTSDFKLKDSERTRRINLGLCLFCGKSGHLLQNCEERKTREASRNNVATRATSLANSQLRSSPSGKEEASN